MTHHDAPLNYARTQVEPSSPSLKRSTWAFLRSLFSWRLNLAVADEPPYPNSNPVQSLLRSLFFYVEYAWMRLQQDTELLWVTVKRLMLLSQETEAMVEEIRRLAAAEAAIEPPLDFAQLPNIHHRGAIEVEHMTFCLIDPHRQLRTGELCDRKLRVLLCQPKQWRSGKTPVIVISHGLGSKPEAYLDYAEHLASHGYLVAVPQHPGSDDEQVWRMLTGTAKELFQLEEFGDRPLDVTAVLNELERWNETIYAGKLNLANVGVIGHSFGGYTALALAGAEINFKELETTCRLKPGIPNLSLLLQCRALDLPRQRYQFRDRRVKAILPIDLLGSAVFSAEGLSHIQIPVLIVAGSGDSTTPAVFEQIRVFPWLATQHCYLALIKGKAHVGNFSNLDAGLKLILRILTNIRGPNSTVFYNYLYSLSLAFFEVHLTDNSDYLPYLQASYAQHISQSPFNLYLISAASCRSTFCEELDQRLRNFILQISRLT